jgi:hypothetical protein
MRPDQSHCTSTTAFVESIANLPEGASSSMTFRLGRTSEWARDRLVDE